MRNLLKVAIAVCAALAAMSTQVKAQTVVLTGTGSSAYFLESGLGANNPNGAINAPCVWSESTKSVVATDTSAQVTNPSANASIDTGNAWVAWTMGSSGDCTTATNIYAYQQTDSVVGNRCLANATNYPTPQCSIAYPTSNPAPAGLILAAASEVSLPTSVANALNSATVNFAGSDIRPEDAEFAIARALTPCGQPVVTGSQYLGLGYSNGNEVGDFHFNQAGTGSSFNVVNFTLPANLSVTIVGATPIIVAANGTGISAGSISAQTLASLLDGTYSYTGQVSSSPAATGSPLTVYLREPVSGTYNTMEYNIPNTTVFQTSQDVGVNQPSGQINCNGSVPTGLVPNSNPAAYDLNISTTSGGARLREIGTGNELAAVVANANGNSLGYGFWSVANFKGFTSSTSAYLEVNGVDPLLNSQTAYTGTIPLTGTSNLANVDLHTTANGTYPIWSLLRLVTVNSAATLAAENLAFSTDDFVSFGTTTSRPDFVVPSEMTVVRSHFIPPAGLGLPTTAANGDTSLGNGQSACIAAESGGDVGGVAILLTGNRTFNNLESDNKYCQNTGILTGQTGFRN